MNGQSRVLLHAWYASTTVQAKAMWTMAISQHRFYLDKRDQEVSIYNVFKIVHGAASLSFRKHGSPQEPFHQAQQLYKQPRTQGLSSWEAKTLVDTGHVIC